MIRKSRKFESSYRKNSLCDSLHKTIKDIKDLLFALNNIASSCEDDDDVERSTEDYAASCLDVCEQIKDSVYNLQRECEDVFR